MNTIKYGNLNTLTKEKAELKGWVLENFIPEKEQFKNGTLGIKWIKEKKGFVKLGYSSQEDVRTYVILFSGKMQIEFSNTGETVILQEEGDYIYFSTVYSDHTTTMLEDTIATAVRWKEI